MADSVSQEIQQVFGVHVESFLGGRLNKHWLVRSGSQKLVLRRWASDYEDASYECFFRRNVAQRGWPVPLEVSDLVNFNGVYWSLAELLPGSPHRNKNSGSELALRGRLLAAFHQSMAGFTPPRRQSWRLAPDILSDNRLEVTFEACPDPAVSHLLLWHLHHARRLATGHSWSELPLGVIHGDFTPWNLLYRQDQLSGLLDFEMSRPDYRVAEFALAWRGQYDDLLKVYNEISPLSQAEWQILTPCWWAILLEGAYRNLSSGINDDGWTARMLRRRTPFIPVPAYPE